MQKIRPSSGRNYEKKNINVKLSPNKKYYLGQSDSKKYKENEKDLNIIPRIKQNDLHITPNYEYNLNFHKNSVFLKALINNKENNNKINDSMGFNQRYKEKRELNNLDSKTLYYSSNSKNKPKNAIIFDKLYSYNLKPSVPIKININNIAYKLSQSADTNKINILANDKIFNNLKSNELLSKAINIISDKKNNKCSHRPLSAKGNNPKNKNNLNDSYKDEFKLLGYQNRMPSPMSSKFSLIKKNNNYDNILNNRYSKGKPMNNLKTNALNKKK